MVAWACCDAYRRAEGGFQAALARRLSDGDAKSVLALVESVSDADRSADMQAAGMLSEICLFTRPLEMSWEKAERALIRALEVGRSDKNGFLASILSDLEAWKTLTQEMAKFCKAKRTSPELRPEEYFAGASGREPNVVTYLQFLAVVIEDANRHRPAQARQSIVAMPENILQMYCFAKFGFRFWSTEEIEAELLARARKLPWCSGYQPPRKGSRLGFEDLLVLGWTKMQELDVQHRLFPSETEVYELRERYKNWRSVGAHSIDIVSESQWRGYRDACKTLLGRAGRLLGIDESAFPLPDLMKTFANRLRTTWPSADNPG
jgi:hypothetical protein